MFSLVAFYCVKPNTHKYGYPVDARNPCWDAQTASPAGNKILIQPANQLVYSNNSEALRLSSFRFLTIMFNHVNLVKRPSYLGLGLPPAPF